MPSRLRVLLRAARRAPLRAGIAMALALGGLAAVAWGAAGDTTLASRATGAAGAKGGAASNRPAVSGDGRSIAFESVAANLDPDDGDGTRDVFVRAEQTTTLVSRAGGPGGAKGDGDSSAAALSADGGAVAFESVATNLDVADGDAIADVFVRDLGEGTTTLASRGVGGAKGNGASSVPAISGDGRFVAFSSVATNLDPDDGDTVGGHLRARRRRRRDDARQPRRRAGGAKGNGPSSSPAISDDGRFVAYTSAASNLDPGDPDGLSDVFVRDLQARPRRSPAAPPAQREPRATAPRTARTSRPTGATSSSTLERSTSAATPTRRRTFVRDLQASTTTLASRATGAEAPPRPALRCPGRSPPMGAPSPSSRGRATSIRPTAT